MCVILQMRKTEVQEGQDWDSRQCDNLTPYLQEALPSICLSTKETPIHRLLKTPILPSAQGAETFHSPLKTFCTTFKREDQCRL